MPEGIIRNMYAGGNTPAGFHSFYKYVIDQSTANRLFILKGGPGTGKSTLIRKVGLEVAKHGFNIEFMHCSSDNNGLDGVVFPDLKVAIIDGTAPHIVDPIYPGAVDEIVNLGNFWDEDGLLKFRDEIIATSARNKEFYARAYRYLRAAAALKEDSEAIYLSALNKSQEVTFSYELSQSLFGTQMPSKAPGTERKLFASAITPRGFADHLDSICSTSKIIRLSAIGGASTKSILESLKREALNKGYDIEAYYCPMDPERIEHLVITQLNISVITANEYHDISNYNNENCTTYLINGFYNKERIEQYSKQLDFNRQYFETLMERAVESIAEAKITHDRLEKYYVKNMEFEDMSRLHDHLIKRILSYA